MSESRQELWVIRHGETEWGAAKRHTGWTDVTLTPMGERQATAWGRVLADREFTSVLCSPLRRARQTSELAGYDAVATVTDGLLERDYDI
jgi:probable phosphoglycerate mutase